MWTKNASESVNMKSETIEEYVDKKCISLIIHLHTRAPGNFISYMKIVAKCSVY